MSNIEVLPELKQIIGSLLFAAKKPLTVKELRKVLTDAGASYGGPYEQFSGIKEDEITAAVAELTSYLRVVVEFLLSYVCRIIRNFDSLAVLD